MPQYALASFQRTAGITDKLIWDSSDVCDIAVTNHSYLTEPGLSQLAWLPWSEVRSHLYDKDIAKYQSCLNNHYACSHKRLFLKFVTFFLTPAYTLVHLLQYLKNTSRGHFFSCLIQRPSRKKRLIFKRKREDVLTLKNIIFQLILIFNLYNFAATISSSGKHLLVSYLSDRQKHSSATCNEVT